MKGKKQFASWWLVVLLSLSLAGARGTSAAQQPQPEGVKAGDAASAVDPNDREETQGIRVRSNLVETPVTVTDSQGEFVYDLSEADFRIFDDGVPQRIESFAQESRPLAVVILVQTSESVSPLLPQLAPVAPLLSNLLLGPEGHAAVVTYDDRVRVALDFSDSAGALAETFKKLRDEGDKARLNDALAQAIALLARRPKSERRVIVVFSDGFDSGSETGEQDLMQRATGADVMIYGLGFSRTKALLKSKPKSSGPSPLDAQVTRPVAPGTPATPTNADNTYGTHGNGLGVLAAAGALIHSATGKSELESYAESTGGAFYSHWKEKTLQDHLSRIAAEIHSQYELAYIPPATSQPGFHRIEVRVMHHSVKVRTRAGYFYAAEKR